MRSGVIAAVLAVGTAIAAQEIRSRGGPAFGRNIGEGLNEAMQQAAPFERMFARALAGAVSSVDLVCFRGRYRDRA